MADLRLHLGHDGTNFNGINDIAHVPRAAITQNARKSGARAATQRIAGLTRQG